MAALFLIMVLAILAVFSGKKRIWGMTILVVGIVLCWLMLWHHATSTLQINL